jgi:hypothetical protein
VTDSLPPTGFWSYTSSDNASAGGRLSVLRQMLADELQLLVGQKPKVRLFQDVATIPYGADWAKAIGAALAESSFLIPIVSPAFLHSEWCCKEVMAFDQRQRALGRDDLIFPFYYVDIEDMAPGEAHDPAVLALLKSKQRFDFRALRRKSPESEEVADGLAALAEAIRKALRRGVGTNPEPPAKPAPRPTFVTWTRVADPPEPPAKPGPRPGDVMGEPPGPEMVLIPAGTFMMGVPEAESKREGINDDDARPVHKVTVPRPFWLGKYPVTRGEYAVFANATGRGGEPWSKPGFPQDDRHPVVNVSHDDAVAYMQWLSQQTGQTYRLPSEAEWEYAARGGTTTARYWGEAAGKTGEHAHFGVWDGTRAAGGFPANPFGLHDMLGNVLEWTADAWHSDYQGAPADGSAWLGDGAAFRVLRGGSWFSVARNVRSADRARNAPTDRNDGIGFRCARVQVG